MAVKDAAAWPQAKQSQHLKYMIPFAVIWLAFSIGMLVSMWPQPREACQVPPGRSVETIFHDATIWTGEKRAYASAMAVLDDGRIACLGVLEEVQKIAQTATKFTSLSDRFVFPGLIDSHVHIMAGGMSLHAPDLSSVKTIAELTDLLRHACGKAQLGAWVEGSGWDEVTWGGPEPHMSWLDEACPQNPVVLHRMDSHKIAVSSLAAKVAGLDESTEDPAGGRIYRDKGGLTGILAESAMDIVKSRIPALPLEAKRRLVQDACQYLLSQGVTFAYDMGPVPTNTTEAFHNLEDVYLYMARRGHLPMRLFAFTPLSAWERLAAYVEANGTSEASMHLFWGGLKEFADGSLGSKTALFTQPYEQQLGEARGSGVRTIAKSVLMELVRKADLRGLQVAIHAIGDLAVDDVIDIFSRVKADNMGKREGSTKPHRIEHAQHLSSPAVASRFAEAGVSAVVNPLHLLPDKRILKARLGEIRAGEGRSYAYKTLLRAGAKLSFGSDFPVVKSEPLLGIFAATFRRDVSEEASYVEAESLTLEQALRATTIEAARLAGLEDHLGSLRAGKLADFVVLSSSPLFIDPKYGIPKVLATYVGGTRVYSAGHNVLKNLS